MNRRRSTNQLPLEKSLPREIPDSNPATDSLRGKSFGISEWQNHYRGDETGIGTPTIIDECVEAHRKAGLDGIVWNAGRATILYHSDLPHTTRQYELGFVPKPQRVSCQYVRDVLKQRPLPAEQAAANVKFAYRVAAIQHRAGVHGMSLYQSESLSRKPYLSELVWNLNNCERMERGAAGVPEPEPTDPEYFIGKDWHSTAGSEGLDVGEFGNNAL